MKKTILIFTLAMITVLFTACSERGSLSESRQQSSAEDAPSSAAPASESEAESQSPAAVPETALDRFIKGLDGFDCGVAYIGYVENGDLNSVRECVKKSPASEKNAFVSEISDDRIILAGGGEIYCVIPTDTNAKLTVNSLNYDENGKEITADVLYSGSGAPILLCCNPSDIMANASVSITSGGKTVKFSPFLSLRDGKLSLPDDLNILDFSEYGF